MTRRPQRGKIYPKVSTMPRQRSEAAQYLNLYKLTVEKKRLQQELQDLEQRRQRIAARLKDIDRQAEGLENTAERIRQETQPQIFSAPTSNVYRPAPRQATPEADYGTVYLEY